MTLTFMIRLLVVMLALCAIAPMTVGATTADAPPDDAGALAMQLQNPVAALISVPFQNNFEWGGGPRSAGFKYTLNFQPVVPIPLSEHWNLISRTIVPVAHQDDVVPDSTQTGMGDITQSFFFSPKAPGWRGWIWGAGPVVLLPTTTTAFLGSEKFALGPTAVFLRQVGGWTYGILANHLVSTGGTRSTSDVNATFLQPFLSYTTSTHTTFVVNTESSYDWENSKWTVPLNPAVTQLVKVGSQPISLSLGPKLYVEGPTGAPDWGLRFAFVLLFPQH